MAWKLVRQDTHGTRFDVARYDAKADAEAAMAEFEAGYPHHQTYYVEPLEPIEVRSSIWAIRTRPEMYFGEEGLSVNDAVFEAMCLALTEAHCGTCTSISVHVSGTTIRVSDNGLGISLAERQGIPFAQRAMTELGACRDHKEHERLKRELCDVGLVVVNAAAHTASVEIVSSGQCHSQRYTCGEPDADFASTVSKDPSGSCLTFNLDPTFLSSQPFDRSAFYTQIEALSIDLSRVALTLEHS